MILDSLKPDHWLFYVIDGILYALILLLLVPILHMCLRLFAKHQTDEGKGKALLAILLILLGAAAVVAQPFAEQMGYFILLPCLLLGAGVLRWICWVSIPRGLVIMLIFGAAVYGANMGIMKIANKVLPKDRVTLVSVVQKSLGRLDEASEWAKKQAAEEAAKGPRERMTMSNLLVRAKGGLRLEAESFVSAVALLKDPEQLARLTSEHTDDLKALDLLADGETLTPTDMVEMGIINEQAEKGMTVLESVNATNEITAADVEDVALFIRSIRKDGSEVTANDALVVIREARKRAAGRSPLGELVTLTAQNTADLTGLGPILDGGKLAPEQLAGMGVADEGAKKGISVLEGIRGTNDIGEQDVESVMSLLKSMRKDGSEVSTNDALVVIREAMKRAGRSPTNEMFAIKASGIASNAMSSTSEVAMAKVVIHQKVRKLDPLLALGDAERSAWIRSQTGLVVTAVMALRKGNAIGIVNGEMVHTGDLVSVISEGRTFAWRLAGFGSGGVIWEPLVGGTNENESTLIRWQ
jgi:hypothetical protein